MRVKLGVSVESGMMKESGWRTKSGGKSGSGGRTGSGERTEVGLKNGDGWEDRGRSCDEKPNRVRDGISQVSGAGGLHELWILGSRGEGRMAAAAAAAT